MVCINLDVLYDGLVGDPDIIDMGDVTLGALKRVVRNVQQDSTAARLTLLEDRLTVMETLADREREYELEQHEQGGQ